MDWIQVTIQTATAGIEAVSGRLYQLGINGLEIEDAQDFNDFLENSTQSWDYVDDALMQRASSPTLVRLYLPDDMGGAQTLVEIKSTLHTLAAQDPDHIFGPLTVSLAGLSEQDWAENWKQYYKPLKIGERILIKPEWEDAGDTEGRTVFEINPGMSFGTGTHESTQLCIENLEKIITPDADVLDLGCGSGILSVIALLLGAGHAVAVDIDPNAARIAGENAAKNHIASDRYITLSGDILSDERLRNKIAQQKYDIVLANIVADVIIALAPSVKAFLKPDAAFICSGIISDRLEDVKEVMAAGGLIINKIETKGDWAAIVAGAV